MLNEIIILFSHASLPSSQMIMVVLVLAILLCLLYGILILWFIKGWYKLTKHNAGFNNEAPTHVSIVIALKDEEKNVEQLLLSLQNQSYPKELIEIVLVNDHSSDKTLKLIHKYGGKSVKILSLPAGKTGKLQAMFHGMKACMNNLCLFTDADCKMHSNWIGEMIDYQRKGDYDFIAGPVLYDVRSYLVGILQLDQLSLMVSGASSIGNNSPLFCSGANLLLKKPIAIRILEENDVRKIESGEDEWLLTEFFKKSPQKIGFNSNAQALVSTKAPTNILSGLQQRLRWAKNATRFLTLRKIMIASPVILANAFYLFLILYSVVELQGLKILIAFLLFKSFADLILILPAALRFRSVKFILLLPLIEIFHPFYLLISGILGNLLTIVWKNTITND